MVNAKLLDELVRNVTQAVPEGMDRLRSDFNRNLRAAFGAALARMDLVTREEFDVQRAVLARTRDKLAALEKQVEALEARAPARRRAPAKKKA